MRNSEEDAGEAVFIETFKEAYRPLVGWLGGFFGRNQITREAVETRAIQYPDSATGRAYQAMTEGERGLSGAPGGGVGDGGCVMTGVVVGDAAYTGFLSRYKLRKHDEGEELETETLPFLEAGAMAKAFQQLDASSWTRCRSGGAGSMRVSPVQGSDALAEFKTFYSKAKNISDFEEKFIKNFSDELVRECRNSIIALDYRTPGRPHVIELIDLWIGVGEASTVEKLRSLAREITRIRDVCSTNGAWVNTDMIGWVRRVRDFNDYCTSLGRQDGPGPVGSGRGVARRVGGAGDVEVPPVPVPVGDNGDERDAALGAEATPRT